jgi:alpha-glucosidase
MPWESDAAQAGFTAAAQPWLPVPASHRTRAVDRQRRDPDSVLSGWQRFLAWRKRHPALIQGDLHLIDVPDPLVAFERSARNDRVLAVFNLSDQPVAVPAGLVRAGLRILDGHGFACERDPAAPEQAILPPYGALFAAESVAPATVRVLEPAE